MKHKTIQELRDNLKRVLKNGRPKQLKKLRKAYCGKRQKKMWVAMSSFYGTSISESKDIETGRTMKLKGGHRHNHIYNKCHKHIFRGKSQHRIDRKDKCEFVRIFYENLKLNPQYFGEILHTIFYHNRAKSAKENTK